MLIAWESRQVTLDASNAKNLVLWINMIKEAVTEAKTVTETGDEDFSLFRSPGKAWTAREQQMEDEKVTLIEFSPGRY